MEIETGQAEGQTIEGTLAAPETTGVESQGMEGQSIAGEQTTVSGTGNAADAVDTFFDPNDIPEELLPAYKNMQSAFTKKTQAYAAGKHKVEAYDAFEQNPVGTLQTLAQQYGFQLVQPNPEQSGGEQDFQPQTWEEVLTKAEQQAEQKVLKRLEPLIGKVQQLQQSNTESFLDNNYPDWRNYEDQMLGLMKAHPTLSSDPGLLYKMAVPDEVIKSRATKSALSKLQANTANAAVSGQSTTTKTAAQKPDGPLSFNQAVELAKSRIASGRGIAG